MFSLLKGKAVHCRSHSCILPVTVPMNYYLKNLISGIEWLYIFWLVNPLKYNSPNGNDNMEQVIR